MRLPTIDCTAIFIALLVIQSALAQTSHTAPAPCASITAERDQLKKLLFDFPNLAFYRENDATMSAPRAGENRIVFFGDSITQLWDLAASFPGKPYVNRGISGQTTPQMLVRFRQDVIELKPKVVVILAGTNDIAENTGPTTLGAIENNLASMVDLAKANGIRVVLASLLPAASYSWRTEIEPRKKIQTLNAWIRDYARSEGLIFLDYYSATVAGEGAMKAMLSQDGVHPNKEGYAVMAPLAERAITQSLATK